MFRSRLLTSALSTLSAVSISCSGAPAEQDSTGEQFWPTDVETSWEEVRGCRLSPAEHDGYYIRVLTESEFREAYIDEVDSFPTGGVVVKVEYNDEACTDVVRISGMKKLSPGQDPSLFDWQWLRTSTAGTPINEINPRSCAGCHLGCASRDYLCTEP